MIFQTWHLWTYLRTETDHKVTLRVTAVSWFERVDKLLKYANSTSVCCSSQRGDKKIVIKKRLEYRIRQLSLFPPSFLHWLVQTLQIVGPSSRTLVECKTWSFHGDYKVMECSWATSRVNVNQKSGKNSLIMKVEEVSVSSFYIPNWLK
jgi:hypothetical protein